MSVQGYRPGSETISMTPAAVEHTAARLARESAAGLRLSVKPSGCSGYKYVLEFATDTSAADCVFEFGSGVRVFVDAGAMAMVNGTEIDFVKEGLNAFYRFNNPNVTGECGCGESFTVQ